MITLDLHTPQKQPPKVFCKERFSQENTCARVSFLIKLFLIRVFSCEFCKISKNTFFTEHLWTTASNPNISSGSTRTPAGTVQINNSKHASTLFFKNIPT